MDLMVTDVSTDGWNFTVNVLADKAGSEKVAALAHDVPPGSNAEWSMASREREHPARPFQPRTRLYRWTVEGTGADVEREVRALAKLLGHDIGVQWALN